MTGIVARSPSFGRFPIRRRRRGDDHARERILEKDPSALVAAALTAAILSSGSFLILFRSCAASNARLTH
jgi:hypothetical protein